MGQKRHADDLESEEAVPETCLKSKASAGSKLLDVHSIVGFAVQDRIFIDHSKYSESKVIASIGTSSLTLETCLWHDYDVGSSVSGSTRNKNRKHDPRKRHRGDHRTKSRNKRDLAVGMESFMGMPCLVPPLGMPMGSHMGMPIPRIAVPLGRPKMDKTESVAQSAVNALATSVDPVLGAPRSQAFATSCPPSSSSSRIERKMRDMNDEGMQSSQAPCLKEARMKSTRSPVAGTGPSQVFVPVPSRAPSMDTSRINDTPGDELSSSPTLASSAMHSQSFVPRPSQAPHSVPRPSQAPQATDAMKGCDRSRSWSCIDARNQWKNDHRPTSQIAKGFSKDAQRPHDTALDQPSLTQDFFWLESWLHGLDQHGTMLQYLPQFSREFQHKYELAEFARPVPSGASMLHAVDPEIFDVLGIKSLGHRILFAKGIASLSELNETG